ncbi:hypothetical protein [Spirillospora sp. CA-128828]|uniref:hypothetical protein n=1 Tax=Spirillospora sp. CA-128828 TaxID=3240033 RepID=UPI003D92CF06
MSFEDRIRHAKDSGLGRFPLREFAINTTWLMLSRIAADLVAWTRLLALTGDAQVLAVREPKAIRYRFLHVPSGSLSAPAGDGCAYLKPGPGQQRAWSRVTPRPSDLHERPGSAGCTLA